MTYQVYVVVYPQTIKVYMLTDAVLEEGYGRPEYAFLPGWDEWSHKGFVEINGPAEMELDGQDVMVSD